MKERLETERKKRWRKRYYVHPIQCQYAFISAIILLLYTFFIIIFLFGPPALKLVTDVPLEEKVGAARQFLAIAERLWPALFVGMILTGVVIIYITHRLAGPIYRIEKTSREIAEGDLTKRIRLRKNDDLKPIADLLSKVIEDVDTTLGQIKTESSEMGRLIEKIMANPETKGYETLVQDLQNLKRHQESITIMLSKFTLSIQKEDKRQMG
jgi:methyl-accepting chemotaxis protein